MSLQTLLYLHHSIQMSLLTLLHCHDSTQMSLLTFLYGHLLTYLLTPWCRVLLEKLTGLQLVKKLPAFHGTRRFITALTRVRHPSLSWASPIQSIYTHPTSWRSVLISSAHLRLGLPCGLLPSGFPTKTLYTPSRHPYAPHAQPISLRSLQYKNYNIEITLLTSQYTNVNTDTATTGYTCHYWHYSTVNTKIYQFHVPHMKVTWNILLLFPSASFHYRSQASSSIA